MRVLTTKPPCHHELYCNSKTWDFLQSLGIKFTCVIETIKSHGRSLQCQTPPCHWLSSYYSNVFANPVQSCCSSYNAFTSSCVLECKDSMIPNSCICFCHTVRSHIHTADLEIHALQCTSGGKGHAWTSLRCEKNVKPSAVPRSTCWLDGFSYIQYLLQSSNSIATNTTLTCWTSLERAFQFLRSTWHIRFISSGANPKHLPEGQPWRKSLYALVS